jgi:hypothetical protein
MSEVGLMSFQTGVNMADKRSNNVKIGTISSSNVTLNQNQDGVQSISSKHIEYETDDNTVEISPMAKHKKNAAIAFITIVVAAIALLADVAGLLSYFNIPKGMPFFALVPIFIIVAFVTHHDVWVTKLSPNVAHFKNGRWYENCGNGQVASYIKRAKCIYPKCDGSVSVVPAPPRERHNHSVVGKCSVGGVRHTYTVDFNGIGYPQQFDWRPLDNEKKA